jgi:hypothetical protein
VSSYNLGSSGFCETKGFVFTALVAVGCILGASKNPSFRVLHQNKVAVLSAQISLLAVYGSGIYTNASYVSNQVTIII